MSTGEFGNLTNCGGVIRDGKASIGVRAPSDLGVEGNRPFYSCVLSYLAMNASEGGVELALIQTSLLFSCKCKLVSIRTTRFAQ